MQTKREERGDERRTPHRLALLLRFQDRWRSTNSQSLGSRLGTCTYTLLYIECTPAGNRRKPDLEQITDKNQQTQRKGSRQDTRFTVNFLVEFVGSIKVLKEKQTKNSARMSMQCMLYSVGGFICQPRKRWLLRFYVHPSLAGPIG